MSRRSDRVEDLLQAELSSLLLHRMNDPRVKMTTVSDVDVSRDLRHAVVRLSVLGDETERAAALEAVQSATGFLRAELARRLRAMRYQPSLVFELDRGAEHSHRISQLLEGLDRHDDRS